MGKSPETIAPCTASLHPTPHAKGVITRIIGITALVSFTAGTVVGTACNSKETKREDKTPATTKPMIPQAPPVGEEKIKHMLFPETNDLLYRPIPNPQPSHSKEHDEDGVML